MEANYEEKFKDYQIYIKKLLLLYDKLYKGDPLSKLRTSDDIIIDINYRSEILKITKDIYDYEKYFNDQIIQKEKEKLIKSEKHNKILNLEKNIKELKSLFGIKSEDLTTRKVFENIISDPPSYKQDGSKDSIYHYLIFYDNSANKLKYKINEDYEDTYDFKEIEGLEQNELDNIIETLNRYIIKLKSEEIIKKLVLKDIQSNGMPINIKYRDVNNGNYIILSKLQKENMEDTKHRAYSMKIFYILYDKDFLYKVNGFLQNNKYIVDRIDRVDSGLDTELLTMFNKLYEDVINNKYEIYKEESQQNGNTTKPQIQSPGFFAKIKDRFFQKQSTSSVGGQKLTYKLNGEKVALLHNNKKIQRSIYTKGKGKTKYCKINNEFILLSKLKNKIIQ